MGEGRSIWVGKDEHEGVLAQPRKDLKPPPHWRLEAVAATPMPRTLTVGADRRRAVFIEDGDTSDVWLLDLEGGSRSRAADDRPRAGAVLGGQRRRGSRPDGSTVAYADDGHVWLVPAAGGPPRKLVEGDGPRWVDDERLVITVERDDGQTTRLAVVDVGDPWPRRLAVAHGELDAHGDEGEPVVSPDGTEVAYTFTPARRPEPAARSAWRRSTDGAVRRLTGMPRHARRRARVVAGRPDDRLRLRAQRLLRAAPRRARRRGRPPAHERGRRPRLEHDWHPDGAPAGRRARPAQPLRAS